MKPRNKVHEGLCAVPSVSLWWPMGKVAGMSKSEIINKCHYSYFRFLILADATNPDFWSQFTVSLKQ